MNTQKNVEHGSINVSKKVNLINILRIYLTAPLSLNARPDKGEVADSSSARPTSFFNSDTKRFIFRHTYIIFFK